MKQLDLFGGSTVKAPSTEGIKYTGSKKQLIPYILKLINQTNAKTILDGFSGTTRVSQSLAKCDYQVICNDVAIWSEVFATCYLKNEQKPSYYQDLIDHLNSLTPKEGWFTENYGGFPNDGVSIQNDGMKKPWQIHNTKKVDAIREEIDNLKLSSVEKSVALTSLILALDKVDNTLGHHVSYLKKWSPRSYNNLYLRVPQLFQNTKEHSVYRDDIFNLIDNLKVDLAYLDPPYGSNNEKMPPSRVRYASYYHLWTTICLNDHPAVYGKAKRREDTSDLQSSSVFEEYKRNDDGRFVVVDAIEKLINRVDAKWIILSYSSGGRATAEDLNDVISNSGELLDIVELNYKKNVMSKMKWTNEWLRDVDKPNKEYLFLIKK